MAIHIFVGYTLLMRLDCKFLIQQLNVLIVREKGHSLPPYSWAGIIGLCTHKVFEYTGKGVMLLVIVQNGVGDVQVM